MQVGFDSPTGYKKRLQKSRFFSFYLSAQYQIQETGQQIFKGDFNKI